RPHRHLEQRRLADPVGTDDRDALAAQHRERDPVEHALLAVALADPVEREHLPAARPPLGEAEARVAARAARQRLDLDALDHLLPALRLARFGGLRAEALDERPVLRDLRLALLDLALALLARLAPRHQEGLVVAAVGGGGAVV